MSTLAQPVLRKISGHCMPRNYLRAPMPRVQTNAAAQKIEIIRSFLERLDDFKRHEEQSLPRLGRFLGRFAVELPKLRHEEQSWRRATAPNFNVFRALHLERRETKLHSRFLAELLDPNGRAEVDLPPFRGRDDSVRDGLIQSERAAERQHPLTAANTTEEAVNESDRLDIVIRCGRAKFIIIIENKIDAAEGTEQLRRYDYWLQKQQADFRNLVFLTPDGREPETISTDKCLCFSYREHVSAWLRKLVDEVQTPHLSHLRFALDQYLQVLDSF